MKTNLYSLLFFHFLAVIFVIINLSSFSINNFTRIIPLLDIIIIFYFWFQHKIFNISFIFLLGLWHDAILGNFLGVTSLSYLLTIKFFEIINNRLFIKESFLQIWYQFIGFCAIILLLKWLILILLNHNIINMSFMIISWLLTILIYVVMHKLFDFLSEKFLEDVARY